MNVEFHFDFGSPNAYLAHLVIPAIERRTGVAFAYVPVLLGGVFKATGNVSPAVSLRGVKNKGEYAELETRRFLAKHGITRYTRNPFFPVNTLQIMRGAVAARRLGCFGTYVDEVYRHMWAEPKKMDEPEVIRAALQESGLPADELIALASDPAVKQELIDNTERSVARGTFGSPTLLRRRRDLLREGPLARGRGRDSSAPRPGRRGVTMSESTQQMSESPQIRTELDGRVLKIVVDNVRKKNAFVPEMMVALAEALTAFDRNDEQWVAVLCAAGEHTTAGLDMPKFFGPTASRIEPPADALDPFALKRRTLKPVVAVVQGITYTIGIEMMLAADIVDRRRHRALLPDGVEARHRPAGRRALPLPHPDGLGQCDVPPDAVRRVRRAARTRDRAACRRWCRSATTSIAAWRSRT